MSSIRPRRRRKLCDLFFSQSRTHKIKNHNEALTTKCRLQKAVTQLSSFCSFHIIFLFTDTRWCYGCAIWISKSWSHEEKEKYEFWMLVARIIMPHCTGAAFCNFTQYKWTLQSAIGRLCRPEKTLCTNKPTFNLSTWPKRLFSALLFTKINLMLTFSIIYYFKFIRYRFPSILVHSKNSNESLVACMKDISPLKAKHVIYYGKLFTYSR